MAQPFFDRLRIYYESVAAVLRGEADAATIFPNPTDRGSSRERIYSEFLKQHVPSKCNVHTGGFLFDEDGTESKQLDLIVTTDTAPRFNFHNHDGGGRAFSPVEGTIAAISVKSTLDRAELKDALLGFASIPPTRHLGRRGSPLLAIPHYETWPLKVLYASSGINPATLIAHVQAFYEQNSAIPISRRVNVIHVAGSCLIALMEEGQVVTFYNERQIRATPGTYELFTDGSDLSAITLVLTAIQQRASLTSHILFDYAYLINKVTDSHLQSRPGAT